MEEGHSVPLEMTSGSWERLHKVSGDAKFFLMKTGNFASLERAVDQGVWATTFRKNPPQPRDMLNSAYQAGSAVVLIVSITGSRAFQGFALMDSSIPEDAKEASLDVAGEQDKTKDPSKPRLSCPFSIKWVAVFPYPKKPQGVRFTKIRHLKHDNGIPVARSRNCEELSFAIGKEICDMIWDGVMAERAIIAEKLIKKEQREAEQSHFFVASSEVKDSKETWEGFIREIKKLGDPLVALHVGSRAYNLHMADSDVDMLAVFVAPIRAVLSFVPLKTTVKNASSFKPDFSLHEVSLVVDLLAQGNNRLVEALFQDDTGGPGTVVLSTDKWKKLACARDQFITKSLLKQYVSEIDGTKGIAYVEKYSRLAEESVTQEEKGKYLGILRKKWYIVLRLVEHMQQVALRSTLQVFLPDESPARCHIMSIRKGEPYAHHALLGVVRKHIDAMRKAVEPGLALTSTEEEEEEEVVCAFEAGSKFGITEASDKQYKDGVQRLPQDSPKQVLRQWIRAIREESILASDDAKRLLRKMNPLGDWRDSLGKEEHESDILEKFKKSISPQVIPGRLLCLYRMPGNILVGVYAAHTHQFFLYGTKTKESMPKTIAGGLGQKRSPRKKTKEDKGTGKEHSGPHFALMELEKLCQMAITGKATGVDLLFSHGKKQEPTTTETLWEASVWKETKERALDLFVSHQLINKWGKQLQGNIRRLRKAPDLKHLSGRKAHKKKMSQTKPDLSLRRLLRLLLTIEAVSTTTTSGTETETQRSAVMEESSCSTDAFIASAEALLERMEKAPKDNWTKKKEIDTDQLEEWIVSLRLSEYWRHKKLHL